MNDAINAGTLAPCKFCGTHPNPNDPSCATLEQAYARTEVRPFGCPWFTDDDRKQHPLSTPTAPVEPAAGVVAELRNGASVNGVGPRVANLAAEVLESQAKALSEAETAILRTVAVSNGHAARALAAEARLAEIDRIVHVPTPSGEKADHHFQRDFDAIRKLTAPFRAFTNAAKEKTDAQSE